MAGRGLREGRCRRRWHSWVEFSGFLGRGKVGQGGEGSRNQDGGATLAALFLEAGEEEAGEDFFGVFLEEDAVVVDGGVADEGVDGGEVGADDFAVAVGDERGVDEHGFGAFEVEEASGAVEVEVDLLGGEEVEEGDVVAAEAEVLDGAFQFGGFDEEVGDDDDEGALADFFGGGVEGFDEGGFAFGLEGGELVDDEIEVGGAAFGGDFLAVVGPDAPEADGVALVGGEVGEGGGELAGEVHAGAFAGGGIGVIHGAAGIDDEAEAEVGVGFEFFDVEAVGAAPGAPVEAAGVVTGDVFPVLGEFEGGAFDGGAMATGDVAEHGLARVQGEREEAG